MPVKRSKTKVKKATKKIILKEKLKAKPILVSKVVAKKPAKKPAKKKVVSVSTKVSSVTKQKKIFVKKSPLIQTFEVTTKRTKPSNVQDTEQLIEDSKFYVPQEQAEKLPEGDIPFNYGNTRIVLMVRDPYWLHSYWEVTESSYEEARKKLGSKIKGAKEILRVYDTVIEPWSYFDITIFSGARNWYINVPQSGHPYFVEIGFLAEDGTFVVLATSNRVKTPSDKMSDEVDEEWMTIDFERIYALSGGFGIGKSSGEIRTMLEKYLQTSRSSGWISSFSSPVRKQQGGERPFFLVANTELIVYGATEPTAKLFVQGKRINLRRDGSFTLRFALPDGDQFIPIEAIRDDEKERRSITKRVNKRTT